MRPEEVGFTSINSLLINSIRVHWNLDKSYFKNTIKMIRQLLVLLILPLSLFAQVPVAEEVQRGENIQKLRQEHLLRRLEEGKIKITYPVKSTIENISAALEAHYIQNNQYISCVDNECYKQLRQHLGEMPPHQVLVKAEGEQYKIWARDPKLPKEVYYYDNLNSKSTFETNQLWPD